MDGSPVTMEWTMTMMTGGTLPQRRERACAAAGENLQRTERPRAAMSAAGAMKGNGIGPEADCR